MKKSLITTLIITIIILSGCGKKEQNTDMNKNKHDAADKLPADFPTDMPLYKDAKILSNTKTGMGSTVQIEINAQSSAVGDFYVSEMKNKGYQADAMNNNMMKDDRGILTFTKEGTEYSFAYSYNKDKTKTILNIATRTLK